jgi:hypothetical protein
VKAHRFDLYPKAPTLTEGGGRPEARIKGLVDGAGSLAHDMCCELAAVRRDLRC